MKDKYAYCQYCYWLVFLCFFVCGISKCLVIRKKALDTNSDMIDIGLLWDIYKAEKKIAEDYIQRMSSILNL